MAETRQDAITGLREAQVQLVSVNELLMLEVDREVAYRKAIEQESRLWEERYTLAEKRVGNMKGSRLKWTLGLIAGAAAGIYVSSR